ncbi:MAG: YajQ family cyclic di-GMP-binding protein [Deltaproteobacteria bacterium]|nr:YajQ family cyclic di-GMP-binding protein [Deltaproteobacteria bacterium]
MPSFDIVSEVNKQEVTNAVDQSNREVGTRFDFKGSNAMFELEANKVTLRAPNDFQLKQMLDILREKLARRKVDVRCLQVDPPQINVSEAWQVVTVREGIEAELARKIVKITKGGKLKVQAAIQGDKVRVTGKKRDELQQVIAMIKDSDIDLPLQYTNYRD